MATARKPMLITQGDPNGVGPRLIARALQRPAMRAKGVVVVGDFAVLQRAFAEEGATESVYLWTPGTPLAKLGVAVWSPDGLLPGSIEPGCVTPWAGQQALVCVDAATDACLAGWARAMVTAPLAKESVAIHVPGFSGHTGHIAHRCGVKKHCLTLVHQKMWASFVTTHIALKDVSATVTQEGIVDTAHLLHDALRGYGIAHPHIGVAGLNPHAGEHGLFGNEEALVVEPAVAQLQQEGLRVTGPLPADVVFPMLRAGQFDGVVSLYHDQGHPVMKTLAFDFRKGTLRGVNVTLGLPIVRTSPDHGTGFDIAWKKSPDDGSLVDALVLAHRLTRAA